MLRKSSNFILSKVERPLTPPEVKIAKTVKDELREDMVARQVGNGHQREAAVLVEL